MPGEVDRARIYRIYMEMRDLGMPHADDYESLNHGQGISDQLLTTTSAGTDSNAVLGPTFEGPHGAEWDPNTGSYRYPAPQELSAEDKLAAFCLKQQQAELGLFQD